MADLPLEGVRVVDLSWIIAGPRSTRVLAFMGAEVIKVGSQRRPEFQAQGYNHSKLSCMLNLSKPDGVELARLLIAISDVVVENFATGSIERMGLGYDVISNDQPDIVMVSSAGLGHSGPLKDYVGYGSLLQNYTGWNAMTGFPDSPTRGGSQWADPWVGMQLAMVTTAAMNHRLATGVGQHIDFSMAEALISTMHSPILDYQMNDRVKSRMGNRDEWDAPHGAYRCKGDDRWVAIAVTKDDEWRSLCDLMGRPDLAGDTKLEDAEGRKEHEDQLDAAVTAWTSRLDDYEAMHLLQAAGVPAGPSLTNDRLLRDPQLRQTGYVRRIETDEDEIKEFAWVPWRFNDDQQPRLSPPPVLGQDNEYVFKELLGLSEAEFGRLADEKVIY